MTDVKMYLKKKENGFKNDLNFLPCPIQDDKIEKLESIDMVK